MITIVFETFEVLSIVVLVVVLASLFLAMENIAQIPLYSVGWNGRLASVGWNG